MTVATFQTFGCSDRVSLDKEKKKAHRRAHNLMHREAEITKALAWYAANLQRVKASAERYLAKLNLNRTEAQSTGSEIGLQDPAPINRGRRIHKGPVKMSFVLGNPASGILGRNRFRSIEEIKEGKNEDRGF